MTPLTLIVKGRLGSRSVADAAATLAAAVRALSGAAVKGRLLHVEVDGEAEPATDELLVAALGGGRIEFGGGSPFTHMALLSEANGDPFAVFLTRIGGGDGADAEGMLLRAELSAELFQCSGESLVNLAVSIVESLQPDEVRIAPSTWGDELAAWALFRRGWSLVGFERVVKAGSGAILIAHDGEPSEDSASAKERSKRAIDAALQGRRGLAPEVDVQVSRPSAVAAPDAEVEEMLDGTRELPADALLSLTLPFAPSSGSTMSVGGAQKEVAPRRPSGTEDVDVAQLRGALLPFGRTADGQPRTRPPMTLEDYAVVRAHLRVHGESDAATLGRFGLASADAKNALQAHFAAVFRADAGAQERFLDLVRSAIESLSRAPQVSAPSDLDATIEARDARPSRWPFAAASESPLGPDAASEKPVSLPPSGRAVETKKPGTDDG